MSRLPAGAAAALVASLGVLSCHGESRGGAPIAQGAAGEGAGRGPGGASANGGAAGITNAGADGENAGVGGAGTGGSAALGCSDPRWACWPMPNPPASKLPNTAAYSTVEGVVADQVTGLSWQREAPPETYVQSAAASYCDGLMLRGFDDWRLPTRIELVSLVDFTRYNPVVDPQVFPDTSGNFWSSSLSAGTTLPRRFWRVSFSAGGTTTGSEDVPARARCVRAPGAPASSPLARYVLEGQSPDGRVNDAATGLTWQQTSSTETYTFADAQKYCAGLALAGGRWRAPSMKELQTLVDETKAVAPLLEDQAFPGTPTNPAFFWSSSASANKATAAWFVNFGVGEAADFTVVLGNVVDQLYYVRCVR